MLKPEVSPDSITRTLYIGLCVYVIATLVAFLSPALSILVCSALWILWSRMAFMHFVPRHSKDATKRSEMRDNSTMSFAAFWLDNRKPDNKRSSTYEIR